MNKVEEFLLEEAVDDLILSCDKDGEYIYASDMMQKYAEQQLNLSGVGNCPDLTSVWNEAVKKQEKGKHNLYVTNECWGALRLLEKNGLCKISSHLVE